MDIKSKKYLNIFYTIVVIVIVTSFIFYRNLTPTLSKGEGATQNANETILLFSPGFASFSKYFKNEYERNDEFVKCVEEYK